MSEAERGIRRRAGWIAAIVAALALSGIATAAVAVARSTGATTVTTHRAKLGLLLAAANGHTLYMFMHDKGGKSSCYGTCARVWPPLLTGGRPLAAKRSGVNAKLLGTTRRADGKLQVTYNGHPLYLFSSDKQPGDMHGENVNHFGGRWYAVNTSGNPLKPKQQSGGGGGICNPLCPGY